MRLSLTWLLIATAVFGLLMAGIARPTPLWTEIVFSFTLLCLTAAALASIAGSSPRRWFWRGFALVGFGYLVLALYFGDQSRPHLITQRALKELDELARFSRPRPSPSGIRLGPVFTRQIYYNNGHMAWTWALATAGGAFTFWLRQRSSTTSQESPAGPPDSGRSS